MPRMTAPNGATVSVSDEKAERLADQGYAPVKESKAPAMKSASSKSSK